MGGKVVRFDHGAINVNMENPYSNPTNKLCAYSKQVNKRKWNIEAVARAICYEKCTYYIN